MANGKIDKYHFSLWLIKDICWFMKLNFLATLMVIPTLILTIYLINDSIKQRDYFSPNLIFSSWILMNIFWMLHEIHNFPIVIAQIFSLLGLFFLIFQFFFGKKVI